MDISFYLIGRVNCSRPQCYQECSRFALVTIKADVRKHGGRVGDIKPANVFIDNERRAKVVNFFTSTRETQPQKRPKAQITAQEAEDQNSKPIDEPEQCKHAFLWAQQACKMPFFALCKCRSLLLQIGEAKTAEKDSKKAVQIMQDFEKTSQKSSYEELRLRQEKVQAKKDKTVQQRQQNTIISLAHFQIIKRDYSQAISKATAFLSSLVEQAKLSKSINKVFQPERLDKHILSEESKGFKKFFNNAIKLLHSHIHKLVSSFKSLDQCPNKDVDVKIQILSLFWKRYKDFSLYLPRQKLFLRKIEILSQLFRKEKLLRLKFYYEKFYKQIQYWEKQNLDQIVDIYYILLVKKKYLLFKSLSKISEERLQSKAGIMEQLRKNKQRALQNEENNLNSQKRRYFSLVCEENKNLINKKINRITGQRLQKLLKAFEEMRIQKDQPTQRHPHIVSLREQYKMVYPHALLRKFNRFLNNFHKKLAQNGSDLSDYKRKLMAYQLTNNSAYTYQQILTKVYYARHVYIERSFFEQNLEAVLRKEVQYNQMVYLNKVMRGIEESKNRGNQIIFVDYYNVAGDNGRMKEQEDTFLQEITLISAVSFGGFFQCRMHRTKMDIPLFLKEVSSMLQATQQFSTLVFFDRDFPSNWLQREQIFKLRAKNVLLNVPSIEAVPNPSLGVCKLVWNLVEQSLGKIQKNQQNLEKQFQYATSSCKDNRLCELVRKQWEKSKRFSLTVDSENFAHENSSKVSKCKQNVEKMQKQMKSQKIVKRKHFADEQNIDLEDGQSESGEQLQQDEEDILKIQKQNYSESDQDQLFSYDYSRNDMDHGLPCMENIDDMNKQQLRDILPIMLKENPNYGVKRSFMPYC